MNPLETKSTIRSAAVKVWLGLICSLVLIGCSSDDVIVDNPLDDLTEFRVFEPTYSIYINKEELPYACAYFVKDSVVDQVKMVLLYVHPTDTIEIPVTATRSADGSILFEGEQLIENIRHLKVEGKYSGRSVQSEENTARPYLTANISYEVPNEMFNKDYLIPFDGHNGLCYNRNVEHYPVPVYDNDAQRDSCELICKKVNAALADYIQSMTFKFGKNGILTVEIPVSANPGQYIMTYRHRARFWLRYDNGTPIVNFENPRRFYQTLLEASLLPFNDLALSKCYIPEFYNTPGELYLETNDKNTDSQFDTAIVLRDMIQYSFFSMLKDRVNSREQWSDSDLRHLETMEKICNRAYSDKENPVAGYDWAFATWKQ